MDRMSAELWIMISYKESPPQNLSFGCYRTDGLAYYVSLEKLQILPSEPARSQRELGTAGCSDGLAGVWGNMAQLQLALQVAAVFHARFTEPRYGWSVFWNLGSNVQRPVIYGI